MIVDKNDPQHSLANHVDSWSLNGLVARRWALVAPGMMGLVARRTSHSGRGQGGVELGVGPPSRGRGVATRAAILASDWLLDEEGWGQVELRIDDNHHASQRVAGKAGFRRAGRVHTWVESAGREFDDLLDLRSRCQPTG